MPHMPLILPQEHRHFHKDFQRRQLNTAHMVQPSVMHNHLNTHRVIMPKIIPPTSVPRVLLGA
ncbi:hypothetical protein NQ314_012164 [Rhamnusium bicolor]|uniref:Uncharacterized protein n=1 Tax=Rhamnusium bicolor TaxID=1586634 RepID=A0AAV8XE71_9CUCU|nr:hypothetical protein NQ314_012164 [Rhamnusium bicolor]